MSNPSKQKGTRFESEVVAYLVEHGFPAVERRALHGNTDKGDLTGIAGWTFELKSEARIDLAGYMAEAQAEAANAGTEHYAAIVKRRGKGAAHAYAVMPLERLIDLVRRLAT
jgi:Holliday junction resolvase